MIVFTFSSWFVLKYTGIIKNNKTAALIYPVFWLPPLVSVYKSISENAVLRDFPSGFWFMYTEIQTFIWNSVSLAILVFFYNKRKTNKGRRQTFILCGCGIILMLLSWAADYFFGYKNNQNLIPFWMLLWIGLLLFTIKRYRFISITPDFISRDITENIEEGIILLDPDLKIIFTNRAFRQLTKIKNGESILLQNIVAENHVLDGEFSKLILEDGETFRLQINFILQDTGMKVPVDLKVKKVIDSYKDISGFLMIISRVKDIEHFKTRYRITARQIEVIRQLLSGKSNKDIAYFLKIKESTIETHITSIYNKLGINNRIELLNLLSEFNLSETENM